MKAALRIAALALALAGTGAAYAQAKASNEPDRSMLMLAGLLAIGYIVGRRMK